MSNDSKEQLSFIKKFTVIDYDLLFITCVVGLIQLVRMIFFSDTAITVKNIILSVGIFILVTFIVYWIFHTIKICWETVIDVIKSRRRHHAKAK